MSDQCHVRSIVDEWVCCLDKDHFGQHCTGSDYRFGVGGGWIRAQVAWHVEDRTLLGDVVEVSSDGMLWVRYFNGEPWPQIVHCSRVEVLRYGI